MPEPIVVSDVVLDEDPLELAESLEDVQSFQTVISSDEEAEAGSTVYFGAPLPIGDIAEVKAKVVSCKEAGEDLYVITVEVLAVDAALSAQAVKFLQGAGGAAEEAKGGVAWGAPLKQRNGTYAALINSPAGVLTADQLAVIQSLSAAGAGVVKLTHAQRVIVLCTADQIDALHEKLEAAGLRIGVLHKGIRNIRGCCGALCRWSGDLDGLALAIELDKALFGRPMKFDVKIAVSDCSRNCEEGFCVDVGLIGNGKDAYDMYVGGSAAGRQIRAMKLTGGLAEAEIIPAIEKVLAWYDTNANDNERIYRMFERLGAPAAEASKAALADVGTMFLQQDEDVGGMLLKKLARQHAVARMRSELGFTA